MKSGMLDGSANAGAGMVFLRMSGDSFRDDSTWTKLLVRYSNDPDSTSVSCIFTPPIRSFFVRNGGLLVRA